MPQRPHCTEQQESLSANFPFVFPPTKLDSLSAHREEHSSPNLRGIRILLHCHESLMNKHKTNIADAHPHALTRFQTHLEPHHLRQKVTPEIMYRQRSWQFYRFEMEEYLQRHTDCRLCVRFFLHASEHIAPLNFIVFKPAKEVHGKASVTTCQGLFPHLWCDRNKKATTC